MVSDWTEERVKLLRELWATGLSASLIADQIGGVSRNAVLGKAHRLRLSARTIADVKIRRSIIKRMSAPKRRAKRDLPRQVEPDIAPEPFEFTVSAWEPIAGSTPVELEHVSGCRWCVTDPFAPRGSIDLFCDLPVVEGKSWCPEHARRSVGKGTPSERRAVKDGGTAAHYDRMAA